MENKKVFQTDPSLKLMDRVVQTLSHFQYAYRTQMSYCRWIKDYVIFLGSRGIPEDRFQDEINSFLTHLDDDLKLSKSSQKQALNAIVFLYKRVFQVEIDVDIEPAKTRKESVLPVVMTQSEVSRIMGYLKGRNFLMAGLLYGSGLRLMECVRLRVHHLDFKRNRVYVYPVKNGKPREVIMPIRIKKDLIEQVKQVKKIHEQDLAQGNGCVDLPMGLKNKYKEAQKEFIWQYVFPAKKTKKDDYSGMMIRSHVLESGLQKAVKTAALKAKITKQVSCNTFRHSFATHLMENGADIYTVKDLMGHTDIKATQMYLQLMDKKSQVLISPLDAL